MERVIKRFLLHNNRENDDVRESDFDELKQDVQMVRYEMLSYLRQNKEDAVRYTSVLHNGLSLLGEFVCESLQDSDVAYGFEQYKQLDKHLVTELEDYSDTNKQVVPYSRSTSYSKSIDQNNYVKEGESIKSQIWRKLRKRSTNLSLKFEENGTENIQDTLNGSSNANTIRIDESDGKNHDVKKGLEENKEHRVKFEANSFLDLNAINEEN